MMGGCVCVRACDRARDKRCRCAPASGSTSSLTLRMRFSVTILHTLSGLGAAVVLVELVELEDVALILKSGKGSGSAVSMKV